MSGVLTARIPATRRVLPSDEHASPSRVNVIRWPIHVSVNDEPRQPLSHSGYSVDLAGARTLGNAMKTGTAAAANSTEGTVLVYEPQYPRLRPHSAREGWGLIDAAGARALGEALIAAADLQLAAPPIQQLEV
jgi:hypothetical protein